MRKIFIPVLVLLLISSPSAHSAFSFLKIQSKGIKAGLSFASIRGKDVEEEWKAGLRFTGGCFLTLTLNNTLALQPEILYSMKGSQWEETFEGETFRASLKLSYLEIPLLAKFFLLKKSKALAPSFFIGPSLSFKFGGKTRFEWAGEAEEEEIKDMKITDFGLIFGGGLDFSLGRRKMLLDIRYSLGMISIFEHEEMKNHAFAVLFGYFF